MMILGTLPSLAKTASRETVSESQNPYVMLPFKAKRRFFKKLRLPSFPTISLNSLGLYFSIHGEFFSTLEDLATGSCSLLCDISKSYELTRKLGNPMLLFRFPQFFSKKHLLRASTLGYQYEMAKSQVYQSRCCDMQSVIKTNAVSTNHFKRKIRHFGEIFDVERALLS